MKKSILSLALGGLLMASTAIMAQEGEPVLASVSYQFMHINDLNNPEKPIKEEMILHLGKTGSKYQRKGMPKPMAKQPPIATTGTVTRVFTGSPVAVVRNTDIDNTELFQHPKQNTLNIVSSVGHQSYIMTETMPKIDWKIYDETKKIGDYTCQKAIGVYAGRTYTAWFAPELPFENGPWKLWGLPGLILEAVDSKNEVSFIFKELYKEAEGESTATYREKLIKTSEQAFNKAKKAYDDDPVSILQSQLPPNSPKVRMMYMDEDGAFSSGDKAEELARKKKEAEKNKKDNPMELSKK